MDSELINSDNDKNIKKKEMYGDRKVKIVKVQEYRQKIHHVKVCCWQW